MIIVIRTLILYIIVITSLRIMGKKQIGQLEPSELAIAIMISEIASIPLATNDTPLLNGIIPIFVLAGAEIIMSVVILKCKFLRKIIVGHPSIIVKDGKILENTLRKLRYTTDDLLIEMRINGISDFSEISYAILETNGQVSFILNKDSIPPTAKDLELSLKDDPLAFPVITKGSINSDYLKCINRDESWLYKQLALHNLDIHKILILTANNKSIKFIQLEDGGKT